MYSKVNTNNNTLQLVASDITIQSGSYTLDCKTISNYQNLTSNDFYYILKSATIYPVGNSSKQTLNIYKSYDSSTGLLTYGRDSVSNDTPIIYVDVYILKSF